MRVRPDTIFPLCSKYDEIPTNLDDRAEIKIKFLLPNHTQHTTSSCKKQKEDTTLPTANTASYNFLFRVLPSSMNASRCFHLTLSAEKNEINNTLSYVDR